MAAGWEQDEVQEPNADFKPNLVNTVCFLVQFIIQLITFGVNYQGPPFNASIRDTKTLRYTFWWGSVFWAVLSLDLVPELTQMVSLVRLLTHLKLPIHVLLASNQATNLSRHKYSHSA